jgi:adenine-specific DNA-methyltransferase
MKQINERNNGEIFTSSNVVGYILDEVNYYSDINLSNIKILEPAAGKGAFAIEIIHRLFQSSLVFEFSLFDALLENVRFICVVLIRVYTWSCPCFGLHFWIVKSAY